MRDPRKLVAIYFANPNYREEHGGPRGGLGFRGFRDLGFRGFRVLGV